jgi:hypothetical protein
MPVTLWSYRPWPRTGRCRPLRKAKAIVCRGDARASSERERVLRLADMRGCRDLQSEPVWQGRRHRSTHESRPGAPFAAAGRGACCCGLC